MWEELGDHCLEYENLTMEEKLLVDIEMRHWFATVNLQDLCVPMFVFRLAESTIIEKIKEKKWTRKNSKRKRNEQKN